MTTAPWRDPALPAAARVDDLLARMTLEERTAQLYGVWVGADTGDRDGAEVVQLYLHDPVASVTRPDVRLIGYRRVELAPGAATRVTFRFHPDLSAFTDRSGRRVVEPGALELRLAASTTDVRHTARLTLTGPLRELGPDRRLVCGTEVSEVSEET